MTKDHENKSLRELIRDSYDELKQDIRDLTKAVLEIDTALKGSYGQNGMVKKQVDHEKRINKLEKYQWKLVGFFLGVNAVIGFATILIIKYL